MRWSLEGFLGEASDAHRMWGDRGWQGVTVQPGPMALERAQRPEYRMQGKEGEAGWGGSFVNYIAIVSLCLSGI